MSKEKENPSQEDIENIKENIQQEFENDPAEEFIDEGITSTK